MGPGRRLAAVLVLAAALFGAAAAPHEAGTVSTAAGYFDDAAIRPGNSQPALVPAVRTLDERSALLLVAILTTVVGAGAARRAVSRRYRRRTALAAAPLRPVHPRGPPTLQFA